MNTPDPAPAVSDADAVNLDVGARLKRAREDRGFTQNAVATRTRMADAGGKGIARTSLIGYEQGTSQPGLREILLLCEVLRVTPNWLLYGADSAGGPLSQASMEAFALSGKHELRNTLRAALALLALKGHERDSVLSLALSLAGRQLGDLRLSGLLIAADIMTEPFMETLKTWVSGITAETPLAEIADGISRQLGGNMGNRLKFDEDDPEKVVGGVWLYRDPEEKKS